MKDSARPVMERPPVHEAVLHLFRRPLHPELIESRASRMVQQDGYTLTLHLTPQGHAWTWWDHETILTEMIASRQQELPRTGRIWKHRFDRDCHDAYRASLSIVYQMAMQSEMLSPTHFRRVHHELLEDGLRRGMISILDRETAGELSAISLITADARPGCLLINTFHTYPQERIILKTQTLIERAQGG